MSMKVLRRELLEAGAGLAALSLVASAAAPPLAGQQISHPARSDLLLTAANEQGLDSSHPEVLNAAPEPGAGSVRQPYTESDAIQEESETPYDEPEGEEEWPEWVEEGC